MKNKDYSKNNHCACGKLISNNAKKCVSCARKGKYNPNFKDGRTLIKHYCIDCKKEISGLAKRCKSCSKKGKLNYLFNKIGYWYNKKGKEHPMYKRKNLYLIKLNINRKGKKRPTHSKLLRLLWKDKEFREKTLKASMLGRLIKPNKPEKFLIKLFKKLKLPFKYVGNGKVIIGGFCPDFIDEKNKKIIEFNGTYWHKNVKAKDKRKLREYNKLGYKTLIIWQRELKNINRLIKKLNNFNKKGIIR